jgi:hypothetical protein
MCKGVGVVRDKELKLEDDEALHTLDRAGERGPLGFLSGASGQDHHSSCETDKLASRYAHSRNTLLLLAAKYKGFSCLREENRQLRNGR